jgi:membrane protein
MKRPFLIFIDGIRIFIRAGCLDSSAAISFYAFFSFIPIILISIAFIGFVLGTHAGLFDKVSLVAKESLPYLSDRMLADIKGLTVRWKAMSYIGFLSLFLSAELVFSAVSKAMARIFGLEKRWGILRRKVVNLAVFLLAMVSALISVLITAAGSLLAPLSLEVLGFDVKRHLVDSLAFKYLFPVLLVVFTVTLAFRIFSGHGLNLRYSLAGGVAFVMFWEAAKYVFAWYISNVPHYNRFYGSIGAVMVLLLWIFYSTGIFLFSACLAKAAFERRAAYGHRERGRGAKRAT